MASISAFLRNLERRAESLLACACMVETGMDGTSARYSAQACWDGRKMGDRRRLGERVAESECAPLPDRATAEALEASRRRSHTHKRVRLRESTARCRGKWLIDHGAELSLSDAAEREPWAPL
jgi:hypothetical protein